MRKTLPALLCALALSASGGIAVAGIEGTDIVLNSVSKDGKVIMESSGGACHTWGAKSMTRADEDEEYYVMALLDFDPEEYEVDLISRAFMHDGYANFGMWDYDSVIDYFLPAGVYNICIHFTRISDRVPVIVYKENVVVDGDMEFTVSPSDADQLIVFEPKDPLGKPLSGDIREIVDGEDVGVVEEGFLAYTDEMFNVRSKLFGDIFTSTILRWGKWIEDGEMRTNCIDRVYATESDDLFFCAGFGGVTTDASVACLLVSDGSKSQTVTSTADYLTFGQQFIPTPDQPVGEDGNPSYLKGHSCVNNYFLCNEGVPGMQNKTVAAGKRFNQEKIMVWQAPAEERCGMSIMPVPTLYEGYEGYGYLEGLPLVVNGDESVYAGLTNTSTRFRYNSDGVYNVSLCSNPFRAINAETDPVWGTGFPCITVYRDAAGDINWAVSGPSGENRMLDKALLNIKSTPEYDPTSGVIMVEMGDKLSLSLTDSNFILGDIPGTNVTEVNMEVKDAKSVPPAVQSLRTTDAAGNVANEFARPEDGNIEIYCGMFTTAQTEDGVRYYECEAPADVIVEYSANGNDSWKELEAVADPALDFMPGWGKFYKVSLSSVAEASANQWYDLRLTLKGADGETTVQTISPAFKIKEVSSVEDLTDGIDQVEIAAVYSLQGVRLDKPVAGQPCIVMMSDGRIRKVMRR